MLPAMRKMKKKRLHHLFGFLSLSLSLLSFFFFSFFLSINRLIYFFSIFSELVIVLRIFVYNTLLYFLGSSSSHLNQTGCTFLWPGQLSFVSVCRSLKETEQAVPVHWIICKVIWEDARLVGGVRGYQAALHIFLHFFANVLYSACVDTHSLEMHRLLMHAHEGGL